MAGTGTPNAPTVITPVRPHRRLVEHPGRAAIVIGTLAVVISLGVVLLNHSDTDTRTERIFPTAVEEVSPRPGELVRREDTITADLRNGLVGILVIDGVQIPDDQIERVGPLSQISFRPGPGKEFTHFEPGEHTAIVRYWVGKLNEPPSPSKIGSYSWRFRSGA